MDVSPQDESGGRLAYLLNRALIPSTNVRRDCSFDATIQLLLLASKSFPVEDVAATSLGDIALDDVDDDAIEE